MMQKSGIPESNLTFCDIFVNSNYKDYIDNFVKEYKNWDVVMVCNENADISGLPFEVKKDFRVGHST